MIASQKAYVQCLITVNIQRKIYNEQPYLSWRMYRQLPRTDRQQW